MTGVTLQRAYGHSIPVLSAAMAGVLVAGANVSRRACVLERAHRQEAVDGVVTGPAGRSGRWTSGESLRVWTVDRLTQRARRLSGAG